MQKMRTNPVANNGLEEYFNCKSGDELFYRIWESENQEKIVIGIHGLGAHSEYFIQVADQLINRGISVYALDLKYHGKSTGKKGDIKNFKELIEQLHEFICFIHNKNEKIPIYLMGISMGGTISINYSVLYPEEINSLILFAPAVKANVKLSFTDILKIPILAILYIFIKGKPIINILERSESITRNPLRVEYDKTDELRLNKISIRYLLQVASWTKKCSKKESEISHPILIIQGTDDKVVSPDSVKDFFEELKIQDKKFIELKDAYHSLFSDKAMIDENGWEMLRDWILNH